MRLAGPDASLAPFCETSASPAWNDPKCHQRHSQGVWRQICCAGTGVSGCHTRHTPRDYVAWKIRPFRAPSLSRVRSPLPLRRESARTTLYPQLASLHAGSGPSTRGKGEFLQYKSKQGVTGVTPPNPFHRNGSRVTTPSRNTETHETLTETASTASQGTQSRVRSAHSAHALCPTQPATGHRPRPCPSRSTPWTDRTAR